MLVVYGMLNSFFSVFVNAVCCWMLFDVGLWVMFLICTLCTI